MQILSFSPPEILQENVSQIRVSIRHFCFLFVYKIMWFVLTCWFYSRYITARLFWLYCIISLTHRIKNHLRWTSEYNYRYNYLNLSFFHFRYQFFIEFKFLLIRTGHILDSSWRDFSDAIIWIYKNTQLWKFNFHLEIVFYRWKIFF